MNRRRVTVAVGTALIGIPLLPTAIACADSSAQLRDHQADTLFSGGLPAQASDLNLAISFNGTSLVSDGSAVANSGTAGDFDLAIAYGDNSHAFATGGTGDYALAIGQPAGPEDAEADAYAGNATLATVPGTGSHDSAIAINGIAAAGDGNNDSAYADGGSAFAGSGNFDSASESAVNDFAFAGGMPGVQAGLPLSADNDIADVIGNNSSAVAGFNEFGPFYRRSNCRQLRHRRRAGCGQHHRQRHRCRFPVRHRHRARPRDRHCGSYQWWQLADRFPVAVLS